MIGSKRPTHFQDFIGQEHLKSILKTAVHSAQVSNKALGHCLFIGESGYGKTTLAHIVASMMQTRVKVITAYAINKPSDMVSLLNTLDTYDILFIDEIHRLKASVEEVLYIAMEDYAIDMLMPDGTHIRLPLRPFTLIGATNKSESLSQALKNRFVYNCHFLAYNHEEKKEIIARYLNYEQLDRNNDTSILETIAEYVSDTPRDIGNFCVMLYDFCNVHHYNHSINKEILKQFLEFYQRLPGGIHAIHKKYLDFLFSQKNKPVGLKTISMHLGLHEDAVEQDIEPILFKLKYIEKSSRGRMLSLTYLEKEYQKNK